MKPVRFSRKDNPWWPLPDTYPTLSPENQRLARLNVCFANETPEDCVIAWAFFKKHYLESQPPGIWYKPPFYPSPPVHYLYVDSLHRYARNVYGVPRSFAKTTVLLENILLWALTRPFFKAALIKSSIDFVRADFSRLMYQIEHNDRILADFGQLKPTRGQGIWSQSRLFLTNGFELVGRPIEGQILGLRPNFMALDDVEFDPALQIVPTYKTEQLQYFLKNHAEATLDVGCGLMLQGTLLTRKSFLYYAATVSEAEDPTWAYYNRIILAARDSAGQLTWREKFSESRLKQLRESLGAAAYAAQVMNDPGSSQDTLLSVHPTLNQYVIEDQDDALETRPLNSDATLVSWLRTASPHADALSLDTQEIRRPLGETVGNMYRMVLVDYARARGPHSDYSCVMVIGLENSQTYKDTLWVLDLWLDKKPDNIIVDKIWEMASKWRVRVIGIESVAMQKQFYDKAQADFLHRAEREQWMPRVEEITYKGELKKSKESRIMGLVWRFEQFRIKLPRHLSLSKPWSDLYFQIENFTEDGRLLQHDDAIDTLAMVHYVYKPRGNYAARPPDTAEGPFDLLRKGLVYFPGTKQTIMSAFNPNEVPADVRREWEAKQREKQMSGRHRRGRKVRNPLMRERNTRWNLV